MVVNTGTAVTIDTVLDFLSNTGNHNSGQQPVSKRDVLEGILDSDGKKVNVFMRAQSLIQNNSGLTDNQKELYGNAFNDYLLNNSELARNVNTDIPDVNASYGGTLTGDFYRSVAEAGKIYSDLYNNATNFEGDLTTIGYYSVDESEVDSQYPRIVPSSIKIQEQLLNMPIPTMRSKASGLSPDHRSKHIVHLDILYPTFESFATNKENYPSFINILNMFKYMPINGILSSSLSSYFLSEFTFPRLFTTLKKFSLNKTTFNSPDIDFNAEDVEEQKRQYVLNQLQNESLSDIKKMLEDEDPLLDIGINALTESLSSKHYDSYSNAVYAEMQKSNVSLSDIKFPVPVAFKSASVQTMEDMPGAVLARFAFTITSSTAFPHGSIVYRKKDGSASFDATDCYWGQKYVQLASKSQIKESEDIITAYKESYKQGNNTEISLNDIALYYSDLNDGVISYNTADYGSDIVLKKISGAFNSKCIEMPLMNSKFPHVQYMGVNDNGFQLVFGVKGKKAIADFMRLKAKMLDYEKKQTIQTSSAIIENKFLNSVGVYFVSPQSIALESDADNPDFYHLVITFAENSQKYGFEEKLELESGVIPADTLENFKKYFYDLYRIWHHINFVEHDNKISISIPSANRQVDKISIDDEKSYEIVKRLDTLMSSFSIEKEYTDDRISGIFSPMRGQHDVYYGPIFYGIMDAYSRKTEDRPFDGLTLSYFPELAKGDLIELLDEWFETDITVMKNNIEDFIYGITQGYKPPRGYQPNYLGRYSVTEGNKQLLELLNFKERGRVLVRYGGHWPYELIELDRPEGYLTEAYDISNYKNLVDMFHKNGTAIPEEIWNRSFDAIVERKFTRGIGSESFVGIEQMDAAFVQLTSIIFSFKNLWKMVQSEFPNSPTDTMSYLTLYEEGGNALFEASINLSEMEKKEDKVNKFNNRKINLYSDMYAPTYQQLLLSDEGFNQLTGDEFNTKALEWLNKFGPKHGDSGTIPEFKDVSELYNAQLDPQKYISSVLSVGLDNYVDPDIFYARRRDKNLMHMSLLQNKTEIDLSEKGTVPLAIPLIDTNTLLFDEIEEIKSAMPDDTRLAAELKDEAIVNIVEKLNTCISNVGELVKKEGITKSNPTINDSIVEHFQSIVKVDDIFADNLAKLMINLKGQQDPVEEMQYSPDNVINPVKVVNIPLITNQNQFIGRIVWNGEKYKVVNDYQLFGEQVSYTSGTKDFSFSVFDPGTRYENEERQLLHTPDFANSMLKSFPAIRLYFIEEDDGGAHLKDDIYGFSDIIECNISSHMYDNDICRMKLANFGGVLSEMNFTDYEYYAGYTDLDGNKKSVKVVDDAGERFLRKIALRPGIPIMVKMGYGNNIDTLKTVFTGEISEVKLGEVVEIIAQGYQTELHHEYGGFYEEAIFENRTLFENNEAERKKFGFLEILNFILLGDTINNKTGIVARNNMKHLGTPISLYSAFEGFFGEPNSKYSYGDAYKDLGRIFGKNYKTMSEVIASSSGEMFNWFDSFIESRYTGYKGTDLSRNIYISSGNNTAINVASEWLVVNGPTIDGLREVVRYMPNFICTVVPYGKDATLFIGDPNLPYQYRPATKIESKFNAKINAFTRAYSDQSRLGENNIPYHRFISQINNEAKRIKTNIKVALDHEQIDKLIDYKELKPMLGFMVDSIKAGKSPQYNFQDNINRYMQVSEKMDNIEAMIGADVFAKLLYNYFGVNRRGSADPKSIIQFARNLVDYYYKVFPHTLGFTVKEGWFRDTIHDNVFQAQLVYNSPGRIIFKSKAPRDSLIFDMDLFIIEGQDFAREYDYEKMAKKGRDISTITAIKSSAKLIRNSLSLALGGEILNDDNFIYDEKNICKDRVLLETNLFRRGIVNSFFSDLTTRAENTSSIDIEVQGMFSDYYENLNTLKECAKSDPEYASIQDSILFLDQADLIFTIYVIEKIAKNVQTKTNKAGQSLLDEVKNFSTNPKDTFKYMPFNYKIYRDQHVISTEHDLIANNVIATESDMWSSVAVKVPSDTVENINGVWNWGMFQSNIEEGNIDSDDNVYQIDSDQDFKIFPINSAGGINYKGARPGPQDTIENFTEINATTANLAQMVVKFRLAQGLSKMYRGNLITVGRHMKPYDIILLADNINQMYGKVMVERVIQNFSATEGWTTTIVPCGLTHVNSTYVPMKRNRPWTYTLAHGDSFKYLAFFIFGAIVALTIGPSLFVALGWASVAAVKGAINVGTAGIIRTGFFNTLSRLGSAVSTTFTSGALGYTGGFAALGARFSSMSWVLGGAFYLPLGVRGVSDIISQFYEARVHQSLFTTNGKGGTTVVHQPCFSTILYHKGSPFYAGLEEPLATIYGSSGIHNLMEELNDFWLEINQPKTRLASPTPETARNAYGNGEKQRD